MIKEFRSSGSSKETDSYNVLMRGPYGQSSVSYFPNRHLTSLDFGIGEHADDDENNSNGDYIGDNDDDSNGNGSSGDMELYDVFVNILTFYILSLIFLNF